MSVDCWEKCLLEIPSILVFVIFNWSACIIFSLNDYRGQGMNSSQVNYFIRLIYYIYLQQSDSTTDDLAVI